MSLDEEQQRQFVRDPVDSLPASLLERLPPLRLILVPYLEKGHHGSAGLVTFEKPSGQRVLRRTLFDVREEIFLLFGIEQQDVADYHYELFNAVAGLAAGTVREDEFTRFSAQVQDELSRRTRGEVDERSLQWKMKLERRQRPPGRNTKLMHGYARQALEDTLTLYLHGLCCDIDVDAGPRQLGSRYLRRRLELLAEIFPPNPGYLVFPAAPGAPASSENSEKTT